MINNWSAAAILLVIPLGCAAGIRSNLDVVPGHADRRVDELAILPVAPNGAVDARDGLTSEALEHEIAALHTATRLLSADEVGRRMQDSGILDEFTQALLGQELTGVTSPAVFADIADAIGVRHLLLANFSYERKLYSNLTSDTRQDVRVFAQIWDRGDVIWELEGAVSSETGEFTRERSADDISRTAVRELARKLPLRPKT